MEDVAGQGFNPVLGPTGLNLYIPNVTATANNC